MSAVVLVWRLVDAIWLIPAWETTVNYAPFPDRYPLMAQSIVEGGPVGFTEQGARPSTLRGPGFPLWLAAGIVIGGDDSRWMGCWTAVLPALAAGLLAALAARRWGLFPGLLAGAITGLHPIATTASARSMSDEFLAALTVFGVVSLASAARATRPRRAVTLGAIAGLWFGWAILTRNSGVMMLGIALAAYGRRLGARRAGGAALALCLAVALAPALGWSWRSSRLEGRPVFVHSLLWFNWWIGEGVDRGGAGAVRVEDWQRGIRLVLEKSGMTHPDPTRYLYYQLTPAQSAAMERALARAAWEHIAADPMRYAARVARSLWGYWVIGGSPARTLQYMVVVVPLLLLAAAGAVAGGRSRDGRSPDWWLCVTAIVLNWVAVACVFPMARLSLHVYPEVAWLAAGGWAVLGQVAANCLYPARHASIVQPAASPRRRRLLELPGCDRPRACAQPGSRARATTHPRSRRGSGSPQPARATALRCLRASRRPVRAVRDRSSGAHRAAGSASGGAPRKDRVGRRA